MATKRWASRWNLGQTGLSKWLGPLEAEVMKIVWARGEAMVGDVWEALRDSRDIAYDTVRTVLNRLVDKGLLKRDETSRAHVYRPLVSEAEFTQRTMGRALDELLRDLASPAMSYLLDDLGDEDEERILALGRLIEQRRKSRRSNES